jgi:hypothetical protein
MMKLRVALFLGLLFVVCCASLSSAEDAKAEPEPGAEPESEPEAAAEEDAKGAGSSVGKQEAKAGPNNPAAVPMAFPASVIFGMAIVAKYIL